MKENNKWLIITFVLTFALALGFGGLSNVVIEKLNIVLATIVLVLVILIGIFFDMIGMAIATCSEAPFHAMASKKKKGAKEVIRLLKNKSKATNICNDLVGDICGIVSGSACALISVRISTAFSLDLVIVSLFLSAVTATITVGGKAITKRIAMENAEKLLSFVGNVIHVVKPVKD